jgi:ribosome-associated heat shock protein Hsp15
LNEERCKPAREIRVGDALRIRIGEVEWQVVVRELSDKRGPASVAQTLYEETNDSRVKREEQAVLRKLTKEPARGIKGRPSKRNRRMLANWQADQ